MTLFAIPRSWAWTTLGEIAEVVGGVTKDSKKQSDPSLPMVPYLRVANVQRGYLDLANVSTIRVPESTLEKLRLEPGDVLLNEGGDRDKLGRGWVWQGQIPDCIHQNHVFRARIIDGVLHPTLLAFYANECGREWFEREASQTVNLASISLTKIKQLPVPVPPPAEQHRIVAALEDHLSRLGAGTRQVEAGSLRAARLRLSITDRAVRGLLSGHEGSDVEEVDYLERIRLQRSRLVPRKRIVPRKVSRPLAMKLPVSWAIVSMDQLCWDIQYGSSTKASPDGGSGYIPILRMGNIQDGVIRMNAVKYIPQSHPDASALRLSDGDLLFNRTNSAELVGKSAVYRETLGTATFASYLIRCRLVPEVEPDWVSLVLNSPVGRSYIRDVVTQQVGQANVNGTKLATMPIPLPPRAEQRRILQIVENQHAGTSRLASAAAAAAVRASHLRRSLLAEAFAGRLVAQDPGDEPASVLLERVRRERKARPKPQRRRSTASASQKETLL